MNPLVFSFTCTLLPNPKTLLSPNRTPSYASPKAITKCSSSTQQNKPLKKSLLEYPSLFLKVILNACDDFIDTFIDPPRHPCIDPECVLSNNFAPVDEHPPTECQVIKGSLPSCLDGAYIRNGPNPQYLPRGPFHLFDGDGMLHSTRISQGKAIFCSRYVRTYKYLVEKEAGFPIIPNFFSDFNNLIGLISRVTVSITRVIIGQFDPSNGIGVANTSLALFGGNLFALCESDLPYAIKLAPNGDIITIGRHNFDGNLGINMTAHPKIDPNTCEAFAFRFGLIPPFLTYFRVCPNGVKSQDVPIFSVTRPSLVHDFAITRNYAIFPDTQIEMNPLRLGLGFTLPLSTNTTKVPRLGVIPRYAIDESKMKWFKVPGFNMLHAINAWEEDDGDTIVVIAPNMISIEHFLERLDFSSTIEKVKIDLKSGMVSRNLISTRNLDMATINQSYVCKKNKYIYAAIGSPPKAKGVVKLDISISGIDQCDCIVATRIFGPNCFCSEPFFVPKDPNNVSQETKAMASSSRVFGSYCRTLMAAAKSTAAKTTATTPLAPESEKVRYKGILKPVPISPALGKFVGASEISRTGAVKKIWDYIKAHNLQNPANKKEIYCDDKLKTIFAGKDKVGFLEIAKLISVHFQKAS